MCTAIAESRKMFEILPTLKRPILDVGTRVVGGPNGQLGHWPVWFVAVAGRVISIEIETAGRWLREAGLLRNMKSPELTCMHKYIRNRANLGDLQVHVVLFSVVHNVKPPRRPQLLQGLEEDSKRPKTL
jgi:hypothetical protein